VKIGAVNYLNSKPLIDGLGNAGADIRLLLDLPSRLADSLESGRLDVALSPSIEHFRHPDYRIVSDACVACRGPVLSVKLFFRVPPENVRCLSLDEGSRSSGALARILLHERFGLCPEVELLPIGASASDSSADAVLLIGDRAMKPQQEGFLEHWDLGAHWCQWTGLPFVFAIWVARAGTPREQLVELLAEARNRGLAHLAQIAHRESAMLDLEPAVALNYLTENLHFTLGKREREGLKRYYDLCVKLGFVPAGLHLESQDQHDDCYVGKSAPVIR